MFILDLKNIKPINIYIIIYIIYIKKIILKDKTLKLILSYNNYLKFNTSFRN